MDPCDNNTTYQQYRRRRDHRHPSFSSTLLDQIYNSIDDVSMRKKQNRTENRVFLEKILVNRRAVAEDPVRSKNLKTAEPVFFNHSSSSSSDSSGFSSSESDSFCRRSRSPPPIRTTVEHRVNNKQEHGSFLRTKMYSDLKKVKQPVSPGGRLAAFLNSIFTGNTKKPNKINTAATSSTACSSASSFSRSCLSQTTSSSEKSKRSTTSCSEKSKRSFSSQTTSYSGKSKLSCLGKTTSSDEKSKRSVRFLDEDSKRSGHDNEREIRVMEENRRVIEAAKELLRNFQKNKDVVNIIGEEEEEDDDDDDDDDDAASCASSDLFELDNLSAIGIDRYREELPVYETTRLNTNRIVSSRYE